MILLHAHLHIMCYHYDKFHWKPPSGLGELCLPDVMDRRTESWIISPYNCRLVMILLHAHLHIICWLKPPRGLGGVALTRCNGQTEGWTESWIISPYNCRLVMILLHAHLHIMCYHYFKFHWKPPSGLGELRLPDVMDRRTESWIISPYNCRLVMILLHAHLHIMCYHYFKFHWKPPSG